MSNTNEKHIDFCPLSKIMAAGASRLLASRVQSVKEDMQITEPRLVVGRGATDRRPGMSTLLITVVL